MGVPEVVSQYKRSDGLPKETIEQFKEFIEDTVPFVEKEIKSGVKKVKKLLNYDVDEVDFIIDLLLSGGIFFVIAETLYGRIDMLKWYAFPEYKKLVKKYPMIVTIEMGVSAVLIHHFVEMGSKIINKKYAELKKEEEAKNKETESEEIKSSNEKKEDK